MAMGGAEQFQCTLLGTVEVDQSMRNLESQDRLRIAKLCHKAIVNRDIQNSDRTWLLNSQYFNREVDMKMDYTTRDLKLYNGNVMKCKHPIGTISVMVTLDGSGGHLVYIGHDSIFNKRKAVVLAFSSLKDANSMVKQFENFKGQEPSSVNKVPYNISGQQITMLASSPPPIPLAPKPSKATMPPLPPKPSNAICDENNGNIDDQEDYVNEKEDIVNKKEDHIYEDEKGPSQATMPPLPPKPSGDIDDQEKDHIYEDEKVETRGGKYVNDKTNKLSKQYENPELPVQPGLPPRNKDIKKQPQSHKSVKIKPQPEDKGGKGLLKKLNIGLKQEKHKNEYLKKDDQAILNISESKPIQVVKRPLPGLPGEKTSKSNLIEDIPTQDSDVDNNDEFDDDDDDDMIYVNDTLYEKIGLDTKDQERIYMEAPSKNKISISRNRSITNGIDYLIENEKKYLQIVNKIANEKKWFPIEIQPSLGPVEKLPELHKDLYDALNACRDSTMETAKVFIKRKNDFKAYEIIIMNALTFENKMKNLGDSEKTRRKHIHEPLIQVRKRLHFYFMHLEGLLSSAPEEAKIKIQEAVGILKDYCRAGDEGILFKSIRKSPIELKLYKPLRLNSLINVSGTQINNKEYRVLLFEKIIIIALPVEDDLEFQLDIRMELVTIVDNSANPKTLILHVDYSGVRKKETYNFHFKDETVKQEWNNKILAIQKRYMENIRDSLTFK